MNFSTNFFIGLIIVGFMLIIAIIILYFSLKPFKVEKKSKKKNTVDDEIEKELRRNK